MTESELVEYVRQAILAGLLVLAPVVLVGFAVGTLMGLVQAATGIHEQIVGLVPRLMAMVAVLVLVMPWMLEQMVELLRAAAGWRACPDGGCRGLEHPPYFSGAFDPYPSGTCRGTSGGGHSHGHHCGRIGCCAVMSGALLNLG